MALQKTVIFKGITVGDAYLKIQSFSGSKELLKFDLATHSKSGEQSLAVTSFEIPYSIDGSNPIKQAYGYLKTLPEFAGALDC
jgi:hypothetical protein